MKMQRGAALTETFVLMLVLVPLMFGIPMIGKIIDLKQTTAQASRYTAWEATVNLSGEKPENVKEIFYSNHLAQIGGDTSAPHALWGGSREEGDVDSDAPASTERDVENAFWIPTHADVRLDENTGAADPYSSAYGNGVSGNVTNAIQDMVVKTGDAAAGLTGGRWLDDGTQNSMVRGEVSATIEDNGWFGDLEFTDSTVIMHDNWSASNDDQAARRVRTFVPAGAMEDLGNGFALLGNMPLFKELLNLDEAFGHVNMDPLPAGESPFVPGSRVERHVLQPYVE